MVREIKAQTIISCIQDKLEIVRKVSFNENPSLLTYSNALLFGVQGFQGMTDVWQTLYDEITRVQASK